MSDLRYTPLRERHEALGAAFTDFGGWAMPVRYTSDLAEHHAVRTAAGLFDISHMAEFIVDGSRAAAFLDYALAGRISAMKVGKAKYSLLLDATGGILDDVIVYRIGDDRILVISNAGNHDIVATELRRRLAEMPTTPERKETDFAHVAGPPGATLEDISEQVSLVAVQGPRAQEILDQTVGIENLNPGLDDLGYYAWSAGTFAGEPLLVARTGYTGEDGFELLVPNRLATALWDALLTAGAPVGLIPAGLAARDTLRLEAGMPLHGHELSTDIRPAQAGLARTVAQDKESYVGKDAAAADDEDLPILVGLISEGKRAGRAGYRILDPDGSEVGVITSGALSPTLGHPIAMAYVARAVSAPGTALDIDVRGKTIPATVTSLPFYRRTT